MIAYYEPLDLRCPACGAPPGSRCVWVPSGTLGAIRFRRPHADRITGARTACLRRERRQPQPSSSPTSWPSPS